MAERLVVAKSLRATAHEYRHAELGYMTPQRMEAVANALDEYEDELCICEDENEALTAEIVRLRAVLSALCDATAGTAEYWLDEVREARAAAAVSVLQAAENSNVGE